MEEQVGQIWDRLITRVAKQGYAEAAVTLDQVKAPLGVFFRALGGDSALRVTATTATLHKARRNWLQRVAGSGRKVELAWQDETCLYLPAQLDVFPDRQLNRDLYFWLAAMAGARVPAEVHQSRNWIVDNQQRTLHTLRQFQGLHHRYLTLVQAYIALRPVPERLKPEAAALEQAIQQALIQPGSVTALPEARFAPDPVALWLHPDPPRSAGLLNSDDAQDRNAS
ncbi:MAG: nitric oxide reductase, partial [Amphritea sp.]|nr:nitric oxide reductase [Amphritea sp.]